MLISEFYAKRRRGLFAGNDPSNCGFQMKIDDVHDRCLRNPELLPSHEINVIAFFPIHRPSTLNRSSTTGTPQHFHKTLIVKLLLCHRIKFELSYIGPIVIYMSSHFLPDKFSSEIH